MPSYWHYRLFFVNAFLVILGYAVNTFTGLAFVSQSKQLRVGILLFSLLLLIYSIYTKGSFGRRNTGFNYRSYFFLIYLMFLGVVISENVVGSMNRVITFFIPLIYLILFFQWALSYSSKEILQRRISRFFQLIYLFPILVFLFYERSFSVTNVYGENTAFVSNHYGWASTIFILTSFDTISNKKTRRLELLITYTLLVVAIYLLLISGSRSSWLSILFTLPILLFRWGVFSLWAKSVFILIIFSGLLYLLKDQGSAINQRVLRTEYQLEHGQKASVRLAWANEALEKFNEKPLLWLTGLGLFDYTGILIRSGYHNSYLEILFGCGIITFSFFVYIITIRPSFFYFHFYSKRYVTFFPLIVIPFFESNLTGGQFLFFPWFCYMLLYGITPKRYEYKLLPK